MSRRQASVLARTVVVTVVLLAVGCTRQQTSPPTLQPEPYACRKVTGEFVIDGRLNEDAWQKATPITNFYAYSPKDATELSPTEAMVLWDNEHLYVAIVCTDADIWSYSDRPDDELWLGDVGEFFVKPDREAPAYFEFVVSPSGALYDARYPSRGAGGYYRFKGWSSEAEVATTIDGTEDRAADTDVSYTIEMAIPLSAFTGATPPAEGVTWTFGVFRYDYSKRYEQPLLVMSIPESRRNGFHYYEGYADLRFVE